MAEWFGTDGTLMQILLDSLHMGGRAVAIYLVAVIMVKLMGKREVGKLSPLDFVVAVIIGSVAAAPMVDLDLPLLPALIPLVVLAGLEILAAVLALNNKKVRRFLEDTPTIIIRDGQVLKKNMADVRMNMDDLKQVLRISGVVDINQVEEGTLETGGGFSVLKKKEYQPLTINDLQTVSLHNLDQVLNMYARKAKSDLEALVNRQD
jgi:uncharacterized membrane protein YcaP (DUF421 family)